MRTAVLAPDSVPFFPKPRVSARGCSSEPARGCSSEPHLTSPAGPLKLSPSSIVRRTPQRRSGLQRLPRCAQMSIITTRRGVHPTARGSDGVRQMTLTSRRGRWRICDRCPDGRRALCSRPVLHRGCRRYRSRPRAALTSVGLAGVGVAPLSLPVPASTFSVCTNRFSACSSQEPASRTGTEMSSATQMSLLIRQFVVLRALRGAA